MKDLNTIFTKFLEQRKGSVSVEFVLLLAVLTIMLAFMFDLVFTRSTMGKLERTSYSLLNIVKERKQFYQGQNSLSSKDLRDMETLATNLMYGENSQKRAKVVLEYVELNVPDPKNVNLRQRRIMASGSQPTRLGECKPYKPLKTWIDTAPISEEKRSIPLYQVTICVEMESFFKSLTASKQHRDGIMLRSSSHGPSR
ncbi:MAG: tight adherence pilus pseudopilin TadF [Pasteurellaceae bacterium]|nr:tight adherence pilus pseudopilin TadF [Pasteurellaceae bacterium]